MPKSRRRLSTHRRNCVGLGGGTTVAILRAADIARRASEIDTRSDRRVSLALPIPAHFFGAIPLRTRFALTTLLLVPQVAAATGLSVLTVDKVAAFRNDGGLVRVGRDPELASPPSPACPAASAIALSSYPVAHQAGRDDDERRPGLCPMEEEGQ